MSAQEQVEPRYYGIYQGIVVRNDDPEGLGRVTVKVEGVLNAESGWAYPFGWPGAGSAQRGAFDVPPVSGDVIVMFLGGDPERPWWTGGNFGKPAGKSEVPTPLQGVQAADAFRVKAYETARWLVTYDERPGSESLRLEDKVSGDSIEIDGHAMGIQIMASTMVRVVCTGTIDMKAPVIQLGGRTVLQNGKVIG